MVLEITPSQISPTVRSDARRTHDQLMSRALREMWHQRSFMPDVRPLMDLLHHAQQARYEAESAQLRIAMHGARPGPVLRHHLEHIVSQYLGLGLRLDPEGETAIPGQLPMLTTTLAAIEESLAECQDYWHTHGVMRQGV